MGLKRISFCLLVVLLTACEGDFGNKVVGGNFTVYFTDRSDEKLAEKIAVYWKENKLIVAGKQDLQLVRLKNKVQLRIIANSPEAVKHISFEERKLLSELEKDMKTAMEEQALQLVICTNKFEPIYIPTE